MRVLRGFKRCVSYIWEGIKRNKFKIVNGVVIVITILGVGLLDLFKPVVLDLPLIRKTIHEGKLEKIKVGYSKKYVEDLLGTAQRKREFLWKNSEGGQYKITRTDYIEDDFLYTLFYREDESVLGYGLVSKDKHFNPKLPFEDSLPLLKYPQDKYLDTASGEVRFTTFNAIGTRGDASDYEMDFGYGHLRTNNLIVGYGISELGYRKDKAVLYDYITEYIRKAPTIGENNDADMYSLVGDNVTTYEQLWKDEDLKGIDADPEDEHRKKLYPNSVFVMDANFSEGYEGDLYMGEMAFEFIVEQLEFGFLYYRMELFR